MIVRIKIVQLCFNVIIVKLQYDTFNQIYSAATTTTTTTTTKTTTTTTTNKTTRKHTLPKASRAQRELAPPTKLNQTKQT